MAQGDDAYQTNAVDEEQLAHAGRKVKDRARLERQLVRQQMSTRDGREFVWWLLGKCGLYEWIGGPLEQAYTLLGRRAVGLEVLAEVNRHPELALQMQNEAVLRVKRERQENAAARTPRATESKT